MSELNSPDPISELDLMAYVDDQLDPERRIAVEDHLSRHPVLAAQIMDDLRRRDELRLALTEAASAMSNHRLELPAERLGRRLSFRMALHRNRRAIAASILVGAGWFAHAMFGGLGADPASAAHILPVYADEAVAAHRTVLGEARHDRRGCRRPMPAERSRCPICRRPSLRWRRIWSRRSGAVPCRC